MIFRHRDPNAPRVFYVCNECGAKVEFRVNIGEDGGNHEECERWPRGRLYLVRSTPQ